MVATWLQSSNLSFVVVVAFSILKFIPARINIALEGIENKQRLQTLSIDNAWSNKNFLFYLTFRILQHTSSEVNGYNCYKHFKKYKNKEGNW